MIVMSVRAAGLWTFVLAFFVLKKHYVHSETLTPPYFNLGEGKNITATATCGVDTEGPELYCKLIGANSDNDLDVNVIQGQYCDVCDSTRPEKMHPPEFAVDGMETWWQSPPLSRGMKYNEVNLTIELGQEFHVAYVYVKMGNSPRPGLWVLEKSADYGKTYTPWQYFSDSPSDCETFFGRESLQPITKDDSVICSTEYSKIVPLEGGEIPISLLNKRPSANHYFNSTVLQEWTRATNVRLRFLRTKNLLGHLMSVQRQDHTVTRRYFYSIKDISIGGRCMCNGHAQTCDIPDPRDNRVLLCNCRHNTCGAKCNFCCPGFEQKAWRQSKHDAPFTCEPCNCFQHSNECKYDKDIDRKRLSLDIHGRYEGGGVCQNCQHNTEGINCNKCQSKYFRPYEKHWNQTDVCQPCSCDRFYSTGNCAEGSGRCECKKEFQPPNCDACSFGYYDYPDCKPCDCFLNGTQNQQCSLLDGDCACLANFGGKYCKECAPGYYNFPECKRCECDGDGSLLNACEQETGNCTCKTNFAGKRCNECKDGYFGHPNCAYCNCEISGTKEGICDKFNGQCICKEGYGGERCGTCVLGYYGFPDCKPCNCSKVGSHGITCTETGKCSCLANFAGKTCNQCSPGYFEFPQCKPCECDYSGSNGVSCDAEGKCECHDNFAGLHCDSCKQGFYNFPACEDCNCHPAGVVAGFAGCGSVPAGELCKCKERVEGRICNKCKPLYWNLHANNPNGCEQCNCTIAGVLGGIKVCDSEDGQCVCKPSVVARGCSECADGTYHLEEQNLFGCSDCDCDVGGSINNVCNKQTGQCSCQIRVTGRTCKDPIQAHYFETLYQYQYEIEDGYTPESSRVRYAYDESVFPNYSWRGYAVFSVLQKEVITNLYISKSSLYRMVLRFANRNAHTVIGYITITSENPEENPNDVEQHLKVQFRNTSAPAFVTVSGETGTTPSPFVMNPGRWTISIRVNESLFLDYFVLLPEDFYSATILNKKVEKPCTLNETDLCRQFAYPNITSYDRVNGVGGYRLKPDGKSEQLKDFFEDIEHQRKINVLNRVPLLNPNQTEITFNISVRKPGSYILVTNYITPLTDLRTSTINVLMDNVEDGVLTLYSCPYTTMCRQVVTNLQGGVALYNATGNYLLVTLRSPNSNVGIHSIYAVPLEEWSIDFIQPRPICIRRNNTCIPSTFRKPPETKQIQFEQDVSDEIAKNRPPIRDRNTTSYIWLNPSENSIDLKGKVPAPGYYTFVVHYYQPDFPEFKLDAILQNGQFYEATVPVRHCPSESGCRAVMLQADGNNKFSLTENFMLSLKQPGQKDVYLDYLLVIPADLYDQRHLEEEDLDQTGEFISSCGGNHFNIDTNKAGFCRDSVYSITAAHNSGARPCDCDFAGSLSFECEKFGGQCQCKSNIIGRQCKACRTGYYGFPKCQHCNCPSTAYCEPLTGQCICPPHVTGERCDQCEPLTYGYDELIGCEECRCNSLGVKNANYQCNLDSGNCECKEHVVGRTCDKCLAGHHSFPYCETCGCNVPGTTLDICDATTAECLCKRNVVGPTCNFCRDGTFDLQENNEDGCTECFCFGRTARCQSSQLSKTIMSSMKNWHVAAIDISNVKINITQLNLTVIEDIGGATDSVGVDFSYVNISTTPYFAAPIEYLGKRLTSYGGNLYYKLYYSIGRNGSAVSGPDVILVGADTYLTYSAFEQPPQSIEYSATVELIESNFQMPLTGVPARREHIMTVLNNLQGIYIRATYWSDSVTTRLINVDLEEAIQTEHNLMGSDIPLAVSVEECQCPPNYRGLSCEECAPGYYRIESGPHGGYCVQCNCNGHAAECDVNTGVCLNCAHNTKGDHCDQCEVGYHGNALAGTPNDCLICACPMPTLSNNFATACEVSSDGERISCECRDGYFGPRCQSCAPGFFGRPEVRDDFCKPCQCSGNINPEDPSSCDTTTGECLRCLNNTFGQACSLCAPGYFGDAVRLKDCQACICDELGTDHCDSSTGRCVCKKNVIGEKCDRCDLEHYGFQSGAGCVSCDCAEASDSDQCDDVAGQCKCKDGVTGRTCDRCASGYWNYTQEGCVSCGCKTQYSLGFGCNAQTGQCECLKGVIGEKCDQCPHRWAFVPEIGCHQCDSCTHALLDDTDNLTASIDPIIIEFDSAQSGYFTRRRLDNMRESLEKLKPKFDDVDPKQINLEESFQELEGLEQDSKNLNRKSNYSLENSDSLLNKSSPLKDQAEILFDELANARDDADRAIDNIDSLTFGLSTEKSPELELTIKIAEELLSSMSIYNFTPREQDAENELKKIESLLKNITDIKKPVDNLADEVQLIKTDLKGFNNKLDDLYNHTQYSLNTANDAQHIMDKSGKDRMKEKLKNIEEQVVKSQTNLLDSKYLLSNASDLLEVSIGKLKELKNLPDDLNDRNVQFNTIFETNNDELEKLIVQKPEVEKHANDLSERAQELDRLVSESRFGSKDAIKAARAYKDIIDAVKSAQIAVESAENDTVHAVEILFGVTERSYESSQNTSEALIKADEIREAAKNNLEPNLNRSRRAYEPVKKLHDENDALLNDIEKKLKHLDLKSFDAAYNKASSTADNAAAYITNIDSTMNNTFSELPEETEKAKALPKDLETVHRNIQKTEKQLVTINEKLPPIIESLQQLPERQEAMKHMATNIQSSINKLTEQIALARDIANRIKIGVRFYPNTSLELKNPDNLEDLTTSTKISGYFRTANLDGLLWYLGNPNGTNLRRTKTDDYMALVLQNGYPVLKLDIGNGPEQLISEKFVADNVWYQFIIERVGHNAKLTIREELADHTERLITTEKPLDGTYTIFNLDKDKSKLFVGSFPVNYEMQKAIDTNSFDGEIEDLVIGNTPMSLWNFKYGKENNYGAIERDRLVVLQPSTGLRFNGKGYAIYDARGFAFRSKSDINLVFKTFATEGLIFLAGKGKTFLALELRNGKVLYQYNLGYGTKLWATSKAYNDGNWHRVSASRLGPDGQFLVDDETVIDRTSAVNGHALEAIDTISFGGYPKKHNYTDVTEIKFDGCINNVTIMSETIDLRNNIKAYDVTPGCPAKFAPLVSFAAQRPGYVSWGRLAISNDFKVSLKFKTKEKDGLIFYATDPDRNAGISLALVDGQLKVISQKLELVSKDTFNDGDWHVVSVVHNKDMLRIDFDDYGYRHADQPPQIHFLYGDLFVGGLPRRIQPLAGTVGSAVPFHGCIADLTVNGDVKNFANTTERSSEILDKCVLDIVMKEDIPDVHKVPVLVPFDELEPITIPPAEVFTEPSFESGIPKRGDGGLDFAINHTKVDQGHPEPFQPNRPVGHIPPSTAKPPKEPGCALPRIPTPEDGSTGIRFGTQKNSRLEFKTPRGKYRKTCDFTLEFKTTEPDGILFYLSDNAQHRHFMGVTLIGGYLVFSFKGNGDVLYIQSGKMYNDGQWHDVKFSRNGKDGKMVIDEMEELSGSASGDTAALDLKVPFYVGGVHPDDANNVFNNLNTTETLKGCIREVLMNNKPMEKPVDYGTIPCSDHVETGTFFGGGASTYVKLKERFKVGIMFNIKMDIKPRTDSGVLIAVHGKHDYFVLELVKGVMRLTVENGKGPVTATYQPSDNFYLCDGRWHSIQAVKSKNIVTLSVDNIFSDPKIGDRHSTSADTGSPLFLGGHRVLRRKFIETKLPYVGCIRNIYINNEEVTLEPSMIEGNITVGSCRTN